MKTLLNIIITVITALLTLFETGIVVIVILLGLMALFEGYGLLGLFLLLMEIGLFNFLSDQISSIELL